MKMNFNKEYSNFMLSIGRELFEQIERANSIQIRLNRNCLLNFFDDITKIDDEESEDIFNDGNLVFETSDVVDYKNKIIKYIDDLNDVFQIDKNRLKELINLNWKYYDDLDKIAHPFFVFKFDFQDSSAIDKILMTIDFEFYETVKDSDLLLNIKNEWVKNIGNLKGFVKRIGRCFILCLNVNDNRHYSKSTIKHELTHYFQEELKIKELTIKGSKKESIDIPSLNLTKESLDNYLSSKEFPVIINIDLISQLKKIHQMKFKEMKNDEFINSLIRDVIVYSKDFYSKSEFGKEYISLFKNDDISPMSVFCAVNYLKMKGRFRYIIEKCKNAFI